jgi:hypothetical protein
MRPTSASMPRVTACELCAHDAGDAGDADAPAPAVWLADLSAEAIEEYLRQRLRQRVRRKTKGGFIEGKELRSSTVHQEFRVLRRILNVAVRKNCSQRIHVSVWSSRSR